MEQWLQSNLLSLSYISTANKKDKARWQTDATDQYRAVQLRTWDTVCCLPAWLTVGWSHKQLLVLFVASAEKTIWRDALVYLSTRRNGPARAQRHPKAERELSRRLSFFFFFFFTVDSCLTWRPFSPLIEHVSASIFCPSTNQTAEREKEIKRKKIWIITRRFNNHYRAESFFFSPADPTSRRALTCGENKLN